jgi:hypothetical protein
MGNTNSTFKIGDLVYFYEYNFDTGEVDLYGEGTIAFIITKDWYIIKLNENSIKMGWNNHDFDFPLSTFGYWGICPKNIKRKNVENQQFLLDL